jgi:hypothetical protein
MKAGFVFAVKKCCYFLVVVVVKFIVTTFFSFFAVKIFVANKIFVAVVAVAT